MWSAFDPETRRQLQSLRDLVRRRHDTPTREWPLIFNPERNELLVVREWPDGSLTAFLASDAVNDVPGSSD